MGVRNLQGGKAAVMADIQPDMVKALIEVGVVWFTCILNVG